MSNKSNETKGMSPREIAEGVATLAVIMLVGNWYFSSEVEVPQGPSETEVIAVEAVASETVAMDGNLEDYAAMTKAERRDLLSVGIAELSGDTEQLGTYTDCMGENAVFKDGDLAFLDVLQWCENERLNNPEVFTSHFNQLDAPDLELHAVRVCRELVRAQLLSPSGADFSFFPSGTYFGPEQRWTVRDDFEAPNSFNVMLPMQSSCSIQHDLSGLPNEVASWTVIELEVTQLR